MKSCATPESIVSGSERGLTWSSWQMSFRKLTVPVDLLEITFAYKQQLRRSYRPRCKKSTLKRNTKFECEEINLKLHLTVFAIQPSGSSTHQELVRAICDLHSAWQQININLHIMHESLRASIYNTEVWVFWRKKRSLSSWSTGWHATAGQSHHDKRPSKK